MKKLLIALAAVLVTAATYGQGTVRFANRDLTSGLDAPIMLGTTGHGPGADYSAQLFLVNGTTYTALTPASSFNPTSGTIADRYIKPQDVTVAGVAGGSSATFVVRAWQTSEGSYDSALSKGQSAPVVVAALGGAGSPPAVPALLAGLQGFTVTAVPEPTVLALGAIGAAAFMLRRRK